MKPLNVLQRSLLLSSIEPAKDWTKQSITSPREDNEKMARVKLIQPEECPEQTALIERIRKGRRGTFINVYKVLLHAPEIANVWLDLVNVVRWKTELDDRLREIVIIRIGYLNRCAYVVKQHVPELSTSAGLPKEQADALADWQTSTFFDARERAALAYADAVTRDIDVPDAVFAELRKHFSERQIVEMTVLIGTYNMHTRVGQALQIDPEPHHT
jgi:alkylhydroperoxidase family enzyme